MSLSTKENIAKIESEILDLRNKLKKHKLYENLKNIEDVKIFMEFHIFAVWDFMSLLKKLQIELTTIKTPWIPSKNSKIVRFINEIVFGEESDLNEIGEPKSHFEMYLDAMKEIGADTESINHFIRLIESGKNVKESLEEIKIDTSIKKFINYTFSIIQTNKSHLVASAFTFGREKLLPDVFLEILNNQNIKNTKLKYYLERHIELDGDEHGPISLEMLSELCGSDSLKWKEALETAKKCLESRLLLWDGINEVLIKTKKE